MLKYIALTCFLISACAATPPVNISSVDPKPSDPKSWTSDSKKRYMWRKEDGLSYTEWCSRTPGMKKYYDVDSIAYKHPSQ